MKWNKAPNHSGELGMGGQEWGWPSSGCPLSPGRWFQRDLGLGEQFLESSGVQWRTTIQANPKQETQEWTNPQESSQALNDPRGAVWSTPGSIPLLSLCPREFLGIIDLLDPQGQSQTQVHIPELASLRSEFAVQEGCSSSKVGPTGCLVLRKAP